MNIHRLSGDHLTRSTTTYNLREYLQPPTNIYKHPQTLANICEYLWTPLNTLRTSSNIFKHFANLHKHLWTLRTLSNTCEPYCNTCKLHRDMFTIHYNHPPYTTLPQSTLRTTPQPSDASDTFRCATLDGGSMGSLPQVRFLIWMSLFYFVTQFLYIVSPSAGKTLDFSLWFSLARCVYIFDVFIYN
jgi:hypothetical protein